MKKYFDAVVNVAKVANEKINPAYPYLMFIVPVSLLIVALVHQASQ